MVVRSLLNKHLKTLHPNNGTNSNSPEPDQMVHDMSHVMRKLVFGIENKDADQLRGNREADQRLCFRYMASTIPLLPKSEISSL